MHSESIKRDLGRTFRELFELSPALDPASIDQVFRVRHDVYCQDLDWEPRRDDGRESDDFDRHAYQCLLRWRETGEPVGCTRLIVARPENPAGLLPFEESCEAVLDRNTIDPARLPRHTMGEVSRLAVVKAFRQRKGEAGAPVSLTDEDFASRGPIARFPYIPVSLYLGAAAIARHVGVEHVFVLTEPRLAEHFGRIGFDIRAVGGTIEHRGERVPSLLSSSKVVAGLRGNMRRLYDVIEESVEAGFAAHPDAQASLKNAA